MTDIEALKKPLSELPAREPIAGILARKLAGERVMIQYLTITKGVSAPQHHHQNEQMMVLLKGRMRMQVGDAAKGELTEIEMNAGQVIHFPPDMPHGGEALEDCEILDIFSPCLLYTSDAADE